MPVSLGFCSCKNTRNRNVSFSQFSTSEPQISPLGAFLFSLQPLAGKKGLLLSSFCLFYSILSFSAHDRKWFLGRRKKCCVFKTTFNCYLSPAILGSEGQTRLQMTFKQHFQCLCQLFAVFPPLLSQSSSRTVSIGCFSLLPAINSTRRSLTPKNRGKSPTLLGPCPKQGR